MPDQRVVCEVSDVCTRMGSYRLDLRDDPSVDVDIVFSVTGAASDEEAFDRIDPDTRVVFDLTSSPAE